MWGNLECSMYSDNKYTQITITWKKMVKKKMTRAKIKYSGSSKEEIPSDFLPCRGYMNQGNVYKEMRDRLQKMINF